MLRACDTDSRRATRVSRTPSWRASMRQVLAGLLLGTTSTRIRGIIEQHWKRQYESCMFRRGYQQLGGTTTWHPKERFNGVTGWRSEEHTSELQSQSNLV